jgi:hypothetical protein
MLQAAVFDGVALDAFSFCEDRLGPAEADIGWCEVVDALMITDVIVVFDEGPYPAFEIIGQTVIVERYAVLQRLMPALDLSLGLGMGTERRAHAACHSDRATWPDRPPP